MTANVETITMNDGTERTTITNEDGTKTRQYVKVMEKYSFRWETSTGSTMTVGSQPTVEAAAEYKADPRMVIPTHARLVKTTRREIIETTEEIISL